VTQYALTVAAVVEFSTKKGRRRQKKEISSIIWTPPSSRFLLKPCYLPSWKH